MKVSLIIPAYNEENRLPAFLSSVLSYKNEHVGQIHEVIVVDDGSTDATSKVVRQVSTKQSLILLTLPKNRGKGGAIKAGIEAATGDVVVFTDADGATPISELPKMIAALQNADVAVGNRWMSGAHVHKSTALRHFAGWVYKTYMSLFGLGDIDTMCGFKGYKVAVARDLFSGLIEERWLFDTEIAYKAVQRGYTIKNFPIEWESKPGSKLDSFTLMKSAFQILPLILKIKRQKSFGRKYSQETQRAYDDNPQFYEQKFQEFFDSFGKELAEKFMPLLNGKRILDVGCGPGHFGEFFIENGFDVLGIDISPEMVALAKGRRVPAQVLDMKEIGTLKMQFDGIWAGASLLHEPKSNTQEIINGFRNALVSKTGLLFISVKEGEREGFEERQNQPGVKRWFSHFTDKEMRKMLQKDFDILLSHKTDVEGKFTFLNYYARRK